MQADGDDGQDVYEYATLACVRPGATSTTTTVYLKAAFCDDAADDLTRKALRATAIVDDRDDDGGLYEGHVVGDQAAEQSPRHATGHGDGDRSAAVRAWSADARAALLGGEAEYENHLQRDAADGGRVTLTLTWKLKIRPFGLMPLGAVQLTMIVPAEVGLGPACDRFVGPLVGALSAERRRRLLSDMSAADGERRRSDDNRRLLDAVRSMTEGRRDGELRLMARCAELLNAKKRRIADLQQQLADLKRDAAPQPTVVQAAATVDRRRRGAGRGRAVSVKKVRHMKWCSSPDRTDDATGNMVVDEQIDSPDSSPPSPAALGPPVEKSVLHNPWSPSLPVSTTAMAVDAPVDPRYLADTQIDSPDSSPTWLQQPVTVSQPTSGQQSPGRHDNQPVEKAKLDNPWSPSKTVSTTATAVDAPMKTAYSADTQIDSPGNSPTWLQQPLTVTPPTRVQPSPDRHDEHQPPVKNSVLDNLWSGIL